MKTKTACLTIFLLGVLLAACGGASEAPVEEAAPAAMEAPAELAPAEPEPTYPPPKFINHPAPELTENLAAFAFGGCDAESGLCPADSPIGQLGCQKVVARDLLGGLNPAVPSAWCVVESGEPVDSNAFTLYDQPYPHYRSILLFNNDQYYLANDPQVIKNLYAPIETPEEALSYTLLLNDLSPKYDQGIIPRTEYLTPVVEDTTITKTSNGYQLHLFASQPLNLCEWITNAVNIQLRTDGTLILADQVAQYIEKRC